MFEGDLSAGGSGVHLRGKCADDDTGLQVVVQGTANGDWDFKDIHKSLSKNELAKQLALTGTEFVFTTRPIDVAKDKIFDKPVVSPTFTLSKVLNAGFHLIGSISLTDDAKKTSAIAGAIGSASSMTGRAKSSSVPAHIMVTSSRLQVDAGIPGKVTLKPPFYMVGDISWNFALSTTAGLEIGATIPIGYKFPKQPNGTDFVGQFSYAPPQTFKGALTASGGIRIGDVIVDSITMQIAIDAATFATTGLPSSVGMAAKARWAGATWDLAGNVGSNPKDLLLRAAITNANFDTVLQKLPVSANVRSRIPGIFRQINVRKAEFYYAPGEVKIGEMIYAPGLGFNADVDGALVGGASLKADAFGIIVKAALEAKAVAR